MNAIFASLALVAVSVGDRPCSAPACPAAVRACEAGNDSQELLAILREADCPETFLVTLEALATTDPHCPGLLPTAIRGAGRLGMLKGVTANQLRPEQEALSQVLHQICDARGSQTRFARVGAVQRADGTVEMIGVDYNITCPVPPPPAVAIAPAPRFAPPPPAPVPSYAAAEMIFNRIAAPAAARPACCEGKKVAAPCCEECQQCPCCSGKTKTVEKKW
jgi:hypothetical protein